LVNKKASIVEVAKGRAFTMPWVLISETPFVSGFLRGSLQALVLANVRNTTVKGQGI